MNADERQEEIFAVIDQNPGRPERYWPLIVEFVAEWIVSRPGLLPVQPDDLADRWRDEMS